MYRAKLKTAADEIATVIPLFKGGRLCFAQITGGGGTLSRAPARGRRLASRFSIRFRKPSRRVDHIAPCNAFLSDFSLHIKE